MVDTMTKEIGIQKPANFDGDRKKMQSFVLQCKAYLTINGHIYQTDASKIAFILSFLNEKEAEVWRENYFLSILQDDESLKFPTFKEFMKKFEEGFKPVNRNKDAIHKINILRQGKKTAEEIITEFRLLSNQAGYTVSSPADHLHLIDRLQSVLNPSLVRRILLSPDVPTTIDEWATRAMTIDTTYRQTNEVMERLLGDKKGHKSTPNYSRSSSSNNNWRKKKEEKDPDAMDVDTMSTEKRAYLMKKGACFKCEKTGHLAKDHDEFVKKEEDKKKKGKETPKKDLKAIHAMFSGLSKAEKEELLAMSKEDKEEEKDDEEDETEQEGF
jgi:uncharacterized protein DUF4939